MATNAAVIGNLKALLSLDTTNFDKGVTQSEANAKKLADRLSKDLAPSQQRINALVRDFVGNKEIAKALEYATAIQQVGGATKLTATEQARTNKVVQEAIDKYKALGQEAPKNLIKLANATKHAKKPTDDLGAGITGLLGKAKSLAGLFGVTLGAGALVSFASGALNAADEIGDLANKMGVSIEAAQRFRFAARQAGADIEEVSRAIVTMSDKLATGDKSVVAALDRAGLSFNQIRTLKPEEAFRKIADAIGEMPDPMDQARVAMDLFGKSGADLLPMIRDNSLAAADGVRVMSDEVVKQLKDAKQKWQNFWDEVTVITANALAVMSGMAKAFDLSPRKPGPLGTPTRPEQAFGAAKVGGSDFTSVHEQARREMEAALAGMPGVRSPFGPNVPGLPNPAAAQAAFDALHGTPEQQKARLERSERLKKILEGMTGSDMRERVRDLADALKNVTVEDLTVDAIVRLNQELNTMARNGVTIHASLERFRTPGLPISRTPIADLLSGGIGVGEKPSGLMPLQLSSRERMSETQQALMALGNQFFRFNATPDKTSSLGSLFSGGFRGAMDLLPQTILQSLTGGGNIAKSLGSLFGGNIGSSIIGKSTDGIFSGGLGKMLQGSFLGNKLGGMVASFIPGLGALIGPLLGKAFSALGNIGKNTTKQGREEFAKQMGFEGLDNLYAKLQSLGAEGQKLANTGLNIIGKKDEAGNRRWMADVTKFFDRLERVPGKVNELTSALGKFGGVVPKALDPLLDSILGNSALSADLRKQLEGMRRPSWQAAQELATSFGVNMGALGGGFNTSRLADRGFELKRAIELFARFEGSDQDAILRDMADEFSELAQEARRTNTVLPKGIEQFVRRVSEMGLLLDENGEQIHADMLSFAEIEDEYQKQVVSLLEEIRDLLAGPGASGGPVVVPPHIRPRTPIGFDPTDPSFAMPSLAGSSFGSLMDSGAGTPVFSTASGAALSGASGTFIINAIDAAGFEQFLKQRGGAEAVVRSIPNVVERWGGAR